MNGTAKVIIEALAASRAIALTTLEMPRYFRELGIQTTENGIVFRLDKRGFRRYKRRYPYPQTPPPTADTEGIKTALNHTLPSSLRVKSITDMGRYVSIIMEELQ